MPASGARSACLLALAIATVLTVAMAAPVLRAPTQRVFGNELAGRHHDPFTVMRQFAGAPVPRPFFQPLTDLPGKLAGRVLHPVGAYNLVVLATFPLAALFGCLLAFEVTGSRLVSVGAGLAFAFSPFHLAHAVDHPHIAQVQWLPLFLLALWRSVHAFSLGRAALVAVSTGLVALSNFYGGFIAAAVAPFAAVAFWLVPDREGTRGRMRDLAATGAVLLALAVAGLALVWQLAPAVLQDPGRLGFHWTDTVRYSARWWTYLLPPVDHAVLGRWPWETFGGSAMRLPRSEQQIYIGYSVLTLGALALWTWARGRSDSRLEAAPAFAAVALVAFVWSLSPDTAAAGDRMIWPSALLFDIAPIFRAYARFAVVVQLMAVLLASIGAAHLLSRRTHAGAVTAGVLALVLVFEYAPVPWRWRDVLPTSGHRWLARHVDEPRVFDCSPRRHGDIHTLWLAGYPLQHAGPGFDDCGDPDAAVRLRGAGFTHVVVRGEDRLFRKLDERLRPGLAPVYRAHDAVVLEVRAEPAALYVAGLNGLYAREYGGADSWRWSPGHVTLTVLNTGPESKTAAIRLGLRSAYKPRAIRVTLDGQPVQDLTISTRRTAVALGPVTFPPGRSRLELRSVEPAGVPAVVTPRNRDRRPLAFAVFDWEWRPE